MGKLIIKRITSEDCAGLAVDFGDDVRSGSAALRAQHQLVKKCNSEASFSLRTIAQAQQRNLHRRIERHKQQKFLRYAVAGGKNGIALAVPDCIRFWFAKGVDWWPYVPVSHGR